MDVNNIYRQLKFKSGGMLTSVKESEGKYIYDFLKNNKIAKTLEIGFAYGCSSVFIISATQKKHIVIDPFESSYAYLGLKNIKLLKLDKYLVFLEDYSYNVLPKLLSEGEYFDFAFIDGGHRFDDIFIDFFYIDLLLNQKGYVLFHDAWMKSTKNVISWIKHNKKNYQFIKSTDNNFVLLRKIGDYNREWYHFNSFCVSDTIFNSVSIKYFFNSIRKKLELYFKSL
jgi:predicted O-methyltransferase YrrM